MPEPRDFHAGRHAGVLVPLFSIPSRASWGVGEIADLPRFADWLRAAGLDFVQLLPINEMQEGQNSPYSALSAMAIDPIFLALDEVPEFHDAGGEASLDRPRSRAPGRTCAPGPRVDFRTVRALKSLALAHRFRMSSAIAITDRIRIGRARFARFREREAWWLEDYALFRALHDEHRAAYWRDWEPELRDREPGGARARAPAAGRQHPLLPVPAVAGRRPVAPRPHRLRRRRAVRRFSLHGQRPQRRRLGEAGRVPSRRLGRHAAGRVLGNRTGLGPSRLSLGSSWQQTGDEWLRQRARRCSELYDGFRVDHLIGFYRTFVRERDGRSYFTPPDEPSQIAQGERIMRLFKESGRPHHRRGPRHRPRLRPRVADAAAHSGAQGAAMGAALAQPAPAVPRSGALRRRVGGDQRHARYRDPGGMVGRREPGGTSPVRRHSGIARRRLRSRRALHPRIRDALLRALFGAGSDFVIVPFQDLFGWRDRVNVPAVVNDENWTWRLPWAIDELDVLPEARERAGFLRALAEEYGR